MPVDSVHRITTAEYEHMVSAGVFEGRRLELLDGQLVDMMAPQDELHVLIIKRLTKLFVTQVDLLRVQCPLAVGEGWVPEPDLAIEVEPAMRVRPTTARLVVEVSLSSRRRDLMKADAYAAAAIPRYWIVDLDHDCVLEHTDPSPEGYGLIRRLTGDDVLDAHIEGVPPITVADLLAS